MAYVVIQQHKFGRMYLCGWSKRWGAIVCGQPLRCDQIPDRRRSQAGAPSRRDPLPARALAGPRRGAMRRPDEECRVRAAQQHRGNLLHSSGLAANDARHDLYSTESCDGY